VVRRYRFEREEHFMFRESLRKFLQKEAVPNYNTWEKERIIPVSFWKRLGEMGFLCPQVSEDFGGL
jgi:acyl-CoA dehydrogenase